MTTTAMISLGGVCLGLILNIIALFRVFGNLSAKWATLLADFKDLREDFTAHCSANVNAFNNLDGKIRKVDDRQFDARGSIQWVSKEECQNFHNSQKKETTDLIVNMITNILEQYADRSAKERKEICMELRRLSESIAVMESRNK